MRNAQRRWRTLSFALAQILAGLIVFPGLILVMIYPPDKNVVLPGMG